MTAAALAAEFVEPLDGEELADGITPPPKLRGIKGFPKGVSVVKGKYQGRVSYKPTLESSKTARRQGIYTSEKSAAKNGGTFTKSAEQRDTQLLT